MLNENLKIFEVSYRETKPGRHKLAKVIATSSQHALQLISNYLKDIDAYNGEVISVSQEGKEIKAGLWFEVQSQRIL